MQNSVRSNSITDCSGSADLRSHIEQSSVTKKKRVKSVGGKPTPRKKRAKRPTFAADDGNEADVEDNINVNFNHGSE